MKTIRPGGPHPDYRVLDDVDPAHPDAARTSSVQDLWHYSIARMVDACTASGILPFYGPFGDIGDPQGCESQFRSAYLLGCVGAWSLHPSQIDIARRVFSPDPAEIAMARRVIQAIPDGSGVHMLDGKMQDDASWKQSQVLVSLADLLSARDPELAARYADPAGGATS
jgi:malyl-CoA/(S)-citramalyl-CoA lyase